MSIQHSAKSERIELRAQPETKALLEKAARLTHTTISAYLLEAAIHKAKADLKEADLFLLQEADKDAFFSALENPPNPNEALISLFQDE